MKIKTPYLFATTLLAAALMPARALPQTQNPPSETQELRNLVEEMRVQMAKMQSQIDKLTGTGAPASPTQAATAPTTPPAPPPRQNGTIQTAEPARVGATSQHVGDATADYREFSEDTFAAARFNNVPLDPKYQGFFQLPGTQTILKIGGYFKTDFIYDLKAAGNADSFIPSSFPIPQPVDVQNTTVSIRPTRLSLDFRVPYTKVGEVRFYLEGDFFGTTSTTPRLRHAYAQARNFLIGQTFTNFMDPDAFPDGLDFQGPNGMVSLRNPQFRYGVALNSSTTFYISLEKPSSDVIFTTTQFTSQPEAPAPDGTVRLRKEFERGHVQVAGLFRSIGAFVAPGPDQKTGSVFGWGINTSLGLNTFGRDNLIFAVAAGHGISRYIQDTSGLGIDAEPASGVTTHLVATPAVGIEASYQHYWTKRLRSSAIYSYAAVNNTDLVAPDTYNHATYTGTNLIWNPGGSLNVGAEFLYGWAMEQSGQKANAPRIQFSAKYSFVKVDPPDSK
jgi:DcaP outer membrane protein